MRVYIFHKPCNWYTELYNSYLTCMVPTHLLRGGVPNLPTCPPPNLLQALPHMGRLVFLLGNLPAGPAQHCKHTQPIHTQPIHTQCIHSIDLAAFAHYIMHNLEWQRKLGNPYMWISWLLNPLSHIALHVNRCCYCLAWLLNPFPHMVYMFTCE